MKLRFILIVLLSGMMHSAVAGEADSLRVRTLIKQLSLNEKAALMTYGSPAIERLGIPKYNWWNEALHGVARAGEATMFPMPIGMAASFDEALLSQVFTAVSDEARIKNRLAREELAANSEFDMWYRGLTFWTPNINIFRDPRWGRGMETYGEDPYLTGRLGSIVVKSLQGEDGTKLHACAKHYAVHSGPESSRHRFNAEASERDLWETYLPAFRDLVQAGVKEVMFAYNSFRGQPCGASTYLLQDILRKKWGYKGLIISDCGAVDDFYREWGHHYSATAEEAVSACVKAGGQLECGCSFYALTTAVEKQLLSEEEIDQALSALLLERLRLGELDGHSSWDTIPEGKLCCEQHRRLSLKMAHESMVLLQNDGILPLDKDEKIALLGPNAADSVTLWGNYYGTPRHTTTLLEALRAEIPELVYVEGCPLVEGSCDVQDILHRLKGVNTVIFAGGLSPTVEGEELQVEVPGFKGGDRTTIELPQVQRDLIAALSAGGKRIVMVNFSGGAVGLEPESLRCGAILQAWYPGQEGGKAIADILLGTVNPSGHLPLTFYRNDAQIPPFEDYSMAGRTYRFLRDKPLYAFGHGLSYTTFRLQRVCQKGNSLVVSLKNTGKRDGTALVQLFVGKNNSGANDPLKTLRAYQRVDLKAGESGTVVIPLTDETFAWWSDELREVGPAKGDFTLSVSLGQGKEVTKKIKIR